MIGAGNRGGFSTGMTEDHGKVVLSTMGVGSASVKV